MTEEITMVCLAKSFKEGARCLAGKEIGALGIGEWVRPIGPPSDEKLYENNLVYRTGNPISVLDVLSLKVVGKSPHLYQMENKVLDRKFGFVFQRKFSWVNLKTLVDSDYESLWEVEGKMDFSSRKGHFDRVPIQYLSGPRNTLRLIYLEKSCIVFGDSSKGIMKCRLEFNLKGVSYNLPVTDPELYKSLPTKGQGVCDLPPAYCCISLGEPYIDGRAYKLVASIITEERTKDGRLSLHDRAL